MTTLIEQTEAYQQLESGLELVAQRVQRAIVGNAGSPYSLNRATLGGGLYSHGGSRDYNRVLGYPTNVSPEDARYWYARDPLTNNAIGSIAYDSWRKFPKFSEGGDEKTPFAREMNGLTKALNLPQMFVRLDKLQRMGAYAGMLFGINDAMPGNLLQANELNRPISPTRGATIERLAVYSQTQLFPAAYDTETIRYGLPTLWHIQTQPNRNNIVRSQNALIEPPPISVKVHWTRIITMSEEPLEHDVLGVSPFGVIANTVIDALKVAGGSAEASYQNIKQKIIQLLKDSAVAKQLGKTAADQADFEKAVQKRVEQFADSMVSYLRAGETESFQVISGQLHDPTGALNAAGSRLAAGVDKPRRMLFGSESLKTSGNQDERAYAGTIAARQQLTCEPVLRDFAQHCIDYGVVPPPTSGEYHIGRMNQAGDYEWPSIYEPTRKEQSETNKLNAETFKIYFEAAKAGGPISGKEARVWSGQSAETPASLVDKEPIESELVDSQFIANEQMSPLDPLLETPEAEGHRNEWYEAVLAIVMVLDVAAVMRDVRGQDVNSAEFVPTLAAVITQRMLPIADMLNLSAVTMALQLFAERGITNGTDMLPRALNGLEQQSVASNSRAFVDAHVRALLGGDVQWSGVSYPDPRLPNGVDVATAAIAAVLARIMRDPDVGKRVQDKVAAFRESAEATARNRARLIADVAIVAVFQAALWYVVQPAKPTHKQWLRTTSANPDPEHLAQVGVVVEIDKTFPNGDFVSGTRFGCKCGTRYLFD